MRCPQDRLKIPLAEMIPSDLDFTKVGSTTTVLMESEILGTFIMFQGPKDTALYIQPKSSY